MPFYHHGFKKHKGNREALRPVLPRSQHLRLGEMRPPGLLPLLHQNEGAMRPEVLRRLPGGARQGGHSFATVARGWGPVMLTRPHRSGAFIVEKHAKIV